MSPLVTLLVLGLLLVVVIVLLVWAVATTALNLRSPRAPTRHEARPREVGRDRDRRLQAQDSDARPDEGRRRERSNEPDPAPAARPAIARRSNDDIRGAKAAPRPNVPDDAFERFLRSGRDDER